MNEFNVKTNNISFNWCNVSVFTVEINLFPSSIRKPQKVYAHHERNPLIPL